MEKQSLEKIESLVKKSCEVKEIGGLPYVSQDHNLVSPPEVAPVNVMSLSSLVDFVEKVGLKNETHVYHVVSPTKVKVIGLGTNAFAQRELISIADVTRQVENNFNYGDGYSLEKFIIAVQGAFEKTENRDKLIDVCSQVRVAEDDEIEDDGVSQRVSAKAGVHLKSQITLPNPITLKPFKTFPEIEPPEESFVFRVQKDRHGRGVEFKLFQSKSMAWEMNCVAKIKEYLKKTSRLHAI